MGVRLRNWILLTTGLFLQSQLYIFIAFSLPRLSLAKELLNPLVKSELRQLQCQCHDMHLF